MQYCSDAAAPNPTQASTCTSLGIFTTQYHATPPALGTTLSGPIDAVQTQMAVASANGIAVQDYLQIENEVVLVTAVSGTTLTVLRGQNSTTGGTGTTASPHGAVAVSLYQYLDWTKFTDEALDSWYRATDGLGRLAFVYEAGIPALTRYTYDTLGDLTSISQAGGNGRSFTYSSLKRLTSANNPESGLSCYKYDGNGNLTSRTLGATACGPGTAADTGGLTTTYGYNELDQLNSKTYSDTTPTVTQSYDGHGWLISSVTAATSTSTTAASTNYLTFDGFGRVTSSSQVLTGANPGTWTFTRYDYNLADGIKNVTYPSGRTVTTSYDAISGRPQGVTGTLNGTSSTYASSVMYAPHGAIQSVTMGNHLVETTTFNARLQPTQMQAGALLTLNFDYGSTNDNGNVRTQVIQDGSGARAQSYGYDGVNRLTAAVEIPGTAPPTNPVCPYTAGTWCQSYAYDARGNRALLASSSNPGIGVSALLTANTASSSSVPFDANNRWSGTGVTYDNRGNLAGVSVGSSSFSALYDAENRQYQTTVTLPGQGGPTTSTVNYTYDGDGRRILKTQGSATATYVYDAQGNLAAEYSTSATPGSGTRFLTADPLGSVRLVSTGTSTPVVSTCSDYLPFGQEIPSGTNGWGARGCAPDPSETLKFTGKERDAESGLDFFGARYFSSAQGRFTSPDPLLNSGRPWQPQSWNRYAYGLNNPLKFVDPSGLYELDNNCGDNKKCNQDFQQHARELRTQLANLQKKADQVKDPVQRGRLQAGLAALGTEGDHNNVTVGFGPTKGGGAGETTPTYDQATNSYSGFAVTFDPKQLTSSDAYGIAGAHEGTHVSDYENYELNPATAMLPFQIEYRGYQTSIFAASALGSAGFTATYDNKKYELWNGSWAQVDKNITNFVTRFHDQNGQQTHPEPPDKVHNPFPN